MELNIWQSNCMYPVTLKLLLKITVVPKNTTLSKDIQLDRLGLQRENNEVLSNLVC